MPIDTNRTALTLPTSISNEILQTTQEQSAVMRLARRITLPGNGLTIPVILGDPEAAWVNETDEKPAGNPQLGSKIMRGYKLAVIEPFSNEFRRDMAALYDALVARLPGVLAKKFDATVFGPASGAPGSDFDTLGGAVANELVTGSAYDALVTGKINIAAQGGIMNGIALSPQGEGALLLEKDGQQRPLFIDSVANGDVPKILGAPTYKTKGAFVSGNPSGYNTVGIMGDWTQALYGIVQGVTIDISNQATITVGNAQINLWQRNMFAVLAEIEIGFRADVSKFNLLTQAVADEGEGET